MILRVAIGWDHAGMDLANGLIREFQKVFWNYIRRTPSKDPINYPDAVPFVVQHVYRGGVGVLICGTGIGMSMAANRYPGIGAALCTEPLMAEMARAHNNANILVLPGRLMSESVATACVSVFLNTPFEQGRHANRIAQFDPILAHSVSYDFPPAE
jgi:ribose 5-phosphate isomerase B